MKKLLSTLVATVFTAGSVTVWANQVTAPVSEAANNTQVEQRTEQVEHHVHTTTHHHHPKHRDHHHHKQHHASDASSSAAKKVKIERHTKKRTRVIEKKASAVDSRA